MYKLYWAPGSAAMAPQAVLEEIGAAYEPVRVDLVAREHEQADYKRLNPNGRIPTLVDGDFVIFETAAICQYLSDKHNMLSPPLGTQARGRHMQWLTYMTNTVQAHCTDWFHPDWTFADDTDKQAALKTEAERKLYRTFDVLNDGIGPQGPHMLGEQFTLCDIYLAMLTRWSRYFERPMWRWANIERVVGATYTRPAFQRMMQKQGIAWAEHWGQ
ncbi:MAG: glutathione S-transferase family protein [Ferrovibrio sp.]